MNWKKGLVIASVGWYLMMPFDKSNGYYLNLRMPISQWQQWGIFDHAVECDMEATEMRKTEVKIYEDKPTNNNRRIMDVVEEGLCIASDDPRLAK